MSIPRTFRNALAELACGLCPYAVVNAPGGVPRELACGSHDGKESSECKEVLETRHAAMLTGTYHLFHFNNTIVYDF
jgi:hypothetical protein